jgi:hypothetical protein
LTIEFKCDYNHPDLLKAVWELKAFQSKEKADYLLRFSEKEEVKSAELEDIVNVPVLDSIYNS